MQVHYTTFLTSLGCTVDEPDMSKLQPCPLHPRLEHTLRIREDPVTGHPHFCCIRSRCGFSGDILSLVAKVKGLPFTDAAELFRPGNELHSTLVEPEIADVWVDSCIDESMSQAHLKEYLNRCQQALRQIDRGSVARSLLADHGALHRSDKSLQGVPQSVGVLLSDDVPEPLREFERAYYRKDCHVIYKYTYNGRVVSIRVQNLSSENPNDNKTILFTDTEAGVFMEENLDPEGKQILLTPDELTACALYTKHRQLSSIALPIASVRCLPLPFRYHRVAEVVLLNTKDNPLSLDKALQFFTANEVIEGSQKVKLKICDIATPISRLTAAQIKSRINEDIRGQLKMTATRWLALKMAKLLEEKNTEAIYRAFDMQALPDDKRQALLEYISKSKLPKELEDIVSTATNQRHGRFILGNGNMIWQTDRGFKRITGSGESHYLSNTTFSVDACSIKPNGKLVYMCRLRASDDQVPVVSAQLPEVAFSTAAALCKAIDAAFAREGHKTYVAFYDIAGYKWPDIIARVAKGRPILQELEQLGVDDELNIHFPNIVLRLADNDIVTQEAAASIPAEVMHIYNGLSKSTGDSATTAIRQYITSDKLNSYAAAFVAGIAHIAYHIKMSVLNASEGSPFIPRHLFFVEPETGIWTPIFKQLSYIFTGQPLIPHMPSTGISEYLAKMSKLGTLPYITTMPALQTRKIPQVVADSPVSLISMIDSNAAALLSHDPRVSFVVPIDYTEQPYKLHMDDVLALQQAMPAFLLRFLNARITGNERAEFQRTTEPPAIAAYTLIAKMMKSKNKELPADLVQNYYTAIGAAGAMAFFHALYGIIYAQGANANELGLNIMYCQATARMLRTVNPPHIFVTDDTVLLSRQLVNIVNLQCNNSPIFSALALTDEFERNGYLSTSDKKAAKKRYWTLDKTVWEKYVMKTPLVLAKPVTEGNIIQLRRITA